MNAPSFTIKHGETRFPPLSVQGLTASLKGGEAPLHQHSLISYMHTPSFGFFFLRHVTVSSQMFCLLADMLEQYEPHVHHVFLRLSTPRTGRGKEFFSALIGQIG